MTITLRHLGKSFAPSARVVDDVSFEIGTGEIFCLVGPSGCGKTTVLRMLAGFLQPDEGDILFGDRRMNEIPPQRRNTAMVFQHYAIWPHLSVWENVAYGPQARRLEPAVIDARVERALRVTRLSDLAQRKPAQLSGGQQQRVALARALAVEPDLILFDEPLSSLDARLRLELRGELHRIQRETGTTCLYVTHDQEEAVSLADRLAVMNGGRIEQIGTAEEVYRWPVNEFVARFMGEINIVPPGSPLRRDLNAAPGAGSTHMGSVAFRPEAAEIGTEGVPAVVQRCRYLGSKTELEVTTDDGAPFKLWTRAPVAPGETIRFRVASSDLIRF
jgi:ABC-type Fe3+/spermidine/putrescine transport system ATPase subunit